VFAVAAAVSVGVATWGGVSIASDAPSGAPNADSAAVLNSHGDLKKNAIYSRHIRNRQVKHADLNRNSVHSDNVAPDALLGTDIKELTLGQVPAAKRADSAAHADTASHADVADRLSSETVIRRQTLPFTDPFTDTSRRDEGGNLATLATVGPLKVEGLCRITAGDGTGQRPAGGSSPTSQQHGKDDEAESKIMLWSESKALSFRGATGPRSNVPAGSINYDGLTIANPDPSAPGDPTKLPNGTSTRQPLVDNPAGEGNHQFVVATNEDRDESRWVGAADTGGYPGYSSWVGIVNGDDGSAWIASLYTAFRALGVGNECVYGGMIRQIS
jgi:hypothetical protein